MKYVVQTTELAERNITEAFEYIWNDSPQNAVDWLSGVRAAIRSLAEFPHRCAPAREQAFLPSRTLRQQIYHSHRIVFEIHEPTRSVRVLFVRHGSRRTVGEGDV